MFTVGNLITLVIVAFTLIFYRLADKNNRPLEKVKKYAEKCKEDIAAYADEKSMAVKNFGIDLDVEKRAAQNLIKNIQRITEEDLAKKSEAIDIIEKHVNAFESTLKELFLMTDRVQENLNRIRTESASVESASRRVSEARDAIIKSEQETAAKVKNDLSEFERETRSSIETSSADFNSRIQDTRHEIDEINSKLAGIKTGVFDKTYEKLALFEKDFDAELENKTRETGKKIADWHASLTDQVRKNLSETRVSVENEVKTQIGEYQISTRETMRENQAEMEKEIANIQEHSKSAFAALNETVSSARKTFDEWQSSYNAKAREMESYLEKLRRESGENAEENERRVSLFRQNLEDIREEQSVQKKIFDQTDGLKKEMERQMEEINIRLERLDQSKNEIARMENQFSSIKSLEDEVHRKMTSFLSERHRIEVMEKDFERLIRTSQSVEERLRAVSSSDDILQGVQVQIRKLEDAIKTAEENYIRVERKNEVIAETNSGIERNFDTLRKTEEAIKNAENTINSLASQFDGLVSSIEALSAEKVKAEEAVEKIAVLNESLTQIEKRIADMNVAREWLARTETELKALDKDARTHLKLAKGLFESKSGKTSQAGKGAPPPQDRDNVIRLKSQGWTVEEISNAMNISRGEVELILEIGSRG